METVDDGWRIDDYDDEDDTWDDDPEYDYWSPDPDPSWDDEPRCMACYDYGCRHCQSLRTLIRWRWVGLWRRLRNRLRPRPRDLWGDEPPF